MQVLLNSLSQESSVILRDKLTPVKIIPKQGEATDLLWVHFLRIIQIQKNVKGTLVSLVDCLLRGYLSNIAKSARILNAELSVYRDAATYRVQLFLVFLS